MIAIMRNKIIYIVSGLPRSGTSMMMKMLEAGGMDVLTDFARKADEDNPKGYYEFEKAKDIKNDVSWLEEAYGKVFKIVSELLYHLPSDKTYKIIFMRRDINEILASQKKMLSNSEIDDGISDDTLAKLYAKKLSRITVWLNEQDNIKVHYVEYKSVLNNTEEIVEGLNKFIGNTLDTQKMMNVVDPALYRQRNK